MRDWPLLHPHLGAPHLQLLGGSTGFPEASLPVLIQYDGDLGAAAASVAAVLRGGASAPPGDAAEGVVSALGGEPGSGGEAAGAPQHVRLGRNGARLCDAGTATPVHFVDKHIDPRCGGRMGWPGPAVL